MQGVSQLRQTTWWWLSAAVSALLTLVLIYLWMQMNDYAVVTTQLVGERATNEYLESWREHHPAGPALNAEPPIKIKTGVFIQSLKFFNSTEVNLTGYIWQRYQDGIHDPIKPGRSGAATVSN